MTAVLVLFSRAVVEKQGKPLFRNSPVVLHLKQLVECSGVILFVLHQNQRIFHIQYTVSAWEKISNLLDGFNEEQDDSESNQSAQQLPTESKPLALSDGNEALDVDDAQEYIKAVLLQINDML